MEMESVDAIISDGRSEQENLQSENTPEAKFTRTSVVIGIIFAIVSFLFYLADLYWDLNMACKFYSEGWTTYSTLTVIFVVGPSLLVNTYSFLLYADSAKRNSKRIPWYTYIVAVLQLSLVQRAIEVLTFSFQTIKATNQEIANKKYDEMTDANAELTFLKNIEGFGEAAPQAVLQTAILVQLILLGKEQPVGFGFGIIVSIMFSWFSLAVTVTSFNTCGRQQQAREGVKTMSIPAMALHFFWQLFFLSARLTSLGIFFATFPTLAVLFVVVHYFCMFVWLYFYPTKKNQTDAQNSENSVVPEINQNEPQDDKNPAGHENEETGKAAEIAGGGNSKWAQIKVFILKTIAYMAYAFIHIFSRYNVKDADTRNLYIAFYLITFLENTAILLPFCFVSENGQLWSRVSVMVVIEVLFFIGVGLMLCYYKYYHPKIGKRYKEVNLIQV